MRELIRYAMLTVGFRYGSYAAGVSLLIAIVLFAFKFNPLGEFRLLLSTVTLVITVLAMRSFKLIYNAGQLSLTDGMVVSVAMGLVNAFFYALLIFMWATISPKLWQLHLNDQLKTLEQGQEIITRHYNPEQIEKLKTAILAQSKSYLAVNVFFFRFLWNMVVGFMASLYFRK